MILVIHNGNRLQQKIVRCLAESSFSYDFVSNFQAAESLLSVQHYALIIVESYLDTSHLQNVQRLATCYPESWLVAVEGCSDTQSSISNDDSTNEVDYFAVGVDDYIDSKIEEHRFSALLRARIRRCIDKQRCVQDETNEQVFEVGPIKVDPRYHKATVNGQTLDLTAREFSLLSYFCRYPNQVFSRNKLLSEVWGYNHEGYEHTVNTHINRLRNKISKLDGMRDSGQLVQTVWGVGYKLNTTGFAARELTA